MQVYAYNKYVCNIVSQTDINVHTRLVQCYLKKTALLSLPVRCSLFLGMIDIQVSCDKQPNHAYVQTTHCHQLATNLSTLHYLLPMCDFMW